MTTLLTLWSLRLNEGFYERVGSLCVERQSISQWLQLGTFVQERFLEATAASMKVLLDSVQSHVENCTLLWGHVGYRRSYTSNLLHVLWDVLFTRHSNTDTLYDFFHQIDSSSGIWLIKTWPSIIRNYLNSRCSIIPSFPMDFVTLFLVLKKSRILTTTNKHQIRSDSLHCAEKSAT